MDIARGRAVKMTGCYRFGETWVVRGDVAVGKRVVR